MANRTITFLGFKIDVGSVDDLERAALAKVQERAHRLYVDHGSYSVAQAWIEAVLEYLYQQGLQTSNRGAIEEMYSPKEGTNAGNDNE